MQAAGIDVGKANQDLAMDGESGVARFANNRAGITKLVKALIQQYASPALRSSRGSGRLSNPLCWRCCPSSAPSTVVRLPSSHAWRQ